MNLEAMKVKHIFWKHKDQPTDQRARVESVRVVKEVTEDVFIGRVNNVNYRFEKNDQGMYFRSLFV